MMQANDASMKDTIKTYSDVMIILFIIFSRKFYNYNRTQFERELKSFGFELGFSQLRLKRIFVLNFSVMIMEFVHMMNVSFSFFFFFSSSNFFISFFWKIFCVTFLFW